jgi:nucleoside-diphosphate-sugar epimerase
VIAHWKIILFLWLAYAIAYNLALIRKAPRSKKTSPQSRGWGNRARILIVGATGGTGRQLVQQALETGHQVTAFVRKPARLKIEHSNLRIVQGNVLDYASVEKAVEGQSVVLSALGHKRLFWPTKILSRGTGNIMRAMKTHRVPRFICASSLGVGNAVGRLGLPATLLFVPFILPFYLWDRVRQEKSIAENADIDWVIVRPGTLTNGPSRGRFRHDFNVGNYIWPRRIARADVADFMLRQLNDDAYLGTAPGICD